jgi:hypothetical protein
MTYRGRVENGVIVPEAGAELPEGAAVRIDVEPTRRHDEVAPEHHEEKSRRATRFEHYKHILGAINDLPADASERIDDSLYGRMDK